MLYLYAAREVACHCVSFMEKVNKLSGITNFNIELFEKNSKLDEAFYFVEISGGVCSTEFATQKDTWNEAKKFLLNSKWRVTNTQNGEGICVSIWKYGGEHLALCHIFLPMGTEIFGSEVNRFYNIKKFMDEVP